MAMEQELQAARAFGLLLRGDRDAARAYDALTPEQRRDFLLRLRDTPAGRVEALAETLRAVQ